MNKKPLSALILILLSIGIVTLTSSMQPIEAGGGGREAGVGPGDWADYRNFAFSWESNVAYEELEGDIKSFIKNYRDLYSWEVVVLEISDTLVKYRWIWHFRNGTERVPKTYWDGELINASFVDVETGSYSNMFFIASNLSSGDSIYTHYQDWVITETISSVYLGDDREVNKLSNKIVNYTIESCNYRFNFTMMWDRVTGILLEWHGWSEITENNQTVTYTFDLEITGTNRWGYRIWTVDDDAPADFPTIQEALNSAGEGDVIYVRNGTYYEHVVLNKTVSLIGQNRSTTIIDGDGNGTVLHITARYVNVSGFTIRNGYHIPHITCGIKVHESNKVTISDNILSRNDKAIFLYHSNYAIVKNNMIFDNWEGIGITLSNHNRVLDNSLFSNEETGIGIGSNANNNTIQNNQICNNSFCGINIGWSSHNNIVRNMLSRNNQAGIRLDASHNNSIIENHIDSNRRDGIVLFGANSNLVTRNTLIQNGWDGIALWYSNSNDVYNNNFLDNTKQAGSYSGSKNIWDDGYPSGGNYWSDYEERYPNAEELDDSGIWDTTYVIDENNTDHYPLMQPWGIVSGDLRILKPGNGSAITGPVNITFAIENTGGSIEFEKGDSCNRIDLEIEYQLNQTHGWGIQYWSTIDHGLKLSSGEEYTQEIVYDPSEYEEDVPSIFKGEAPYGNTTIRLVHWKQIEDRTFAYGEFGVTEIKVELKPVDTAPPAISVLSPENKTYTTTTIPLNFTVDEPTSWTGYSLNDQPNVTITGNTTLTALSGGAHNITMYANDTALNTGASETVHFTVAPKTLLGTGWGWIRIDKNESVYGRANLYKIGNEQIELVITYEGEEHVRRWNIIFHREYRWGERYLGYSQKWGILIVGLRKHRRWQFWYAFGRGVIAFGFPRVGRPTLMPI